MSKHNNKHPERTWAQAVLEILKSTGQAMTLSELNSAVEAQAPKLVARNPRFWQPKVRQTVQKLRDRGLAENVEKGVWRALPENTSSSDKKTPRMRPL